MPPFSQNSTVISASLGVTETIEILQPLINFFDKARLVAIGCQQ